VEGPRDEARGAQQGGARATLAGAAAAVAREPVNGWLHLSAAVLAAVGLVALAAAAEARASWRHTLGAVVFGSSALLMFGASALYHLAPRSRRSGVYRRLDHSMIYVFIAGTYTPVCLVALRATPLGTVLLAIVWTIAVAGVTQKVFWMRAPRGVSTALYLGLGWIGAVAAPSLLRTAPAPLFGWLLAGGVVYTVGALFYWRRWPRGRPGVFGFHELWHVCVIGASAAHYWAVFAYILPLG
jgi:hemolysin III